MVESFELVFVNLSADRQETIKKQVRSRAAQYSHRVAPRIRKPRDVKSRKKSTPIQPDPPSGSSSLSSRPSSQDSRTGPSIRPKREGTEDDDAGQEADEEVALDLARLKSARTPQLLNGLVKAQSADPFETYPVPAESYFPQILDHSQYTSTKQMYRD